MIFLIEYNRQKGRMVKFKKFNDSDRLKAEKKRLELELDLNQRKIGHEVVILEAEKESILRHTHRRYFETLRGIANSTAH
jgi:hypothetical protein